MKVKILGTGNRKDSIYIRIEKKQGVLEILKKILGELSLEPNYDIFYENSEQKKKSNIKKIIDIYTNASNQKYDLEMFFGKNRIMLVFRTKNKKKIQDLIDKYFKWGKK
jgi:hypothetical protein